jgi:hypothetical protein
MMSYRVFQQYVKTWISERSEIMKNDEKRDQKDVKRFEGKSLDFQ